MTNLASKFEHFYEPFELHLAQDVLSRDQVSRLYQTLPSGIERFVRTDPSHEKQYAMNMVFLVEDNLANPDVSLAPEWRDLVENLQDRRFLDWMEDGLGRKVRHLITDISIYTHEDGDFISVHKDKPHKAITGVLYLNNDWPATAGGSYEVRASGDPEEDPVRVIIPRGGQFLAFPPTDVSWHAVSPVHTHGQLKRLTVQLEYWYEKKPR